jgi:hypothetical protein
MHAYIRLGSYISSGGGKCAIFLKYQTRTKNLKLTNSLAYRDEVSVMANEFYKTDALLLYAVLC